MSELRTIGYVVQNEGGLMVAVDGILYLGREATLFHTYESARAATRRTSRFASREGLPWNQDYRIRPIVAETRSDARG